MPTILVLGVGIASAAVIRQTMLNVVMKRKDLKMVVVTPNTHFLWPIAMPRVIVPGVMPDDKAMFDLKPMFKDYPADKFEFVLGAASSLDPDSKAVTVALNQGGDRTIGYDTLVIATGSSAKDDMPWRVGANSEQTVERLRKVQNDIKAAKTIAVVGGGLTGAEVAGELGFEYSKNGSKQVIFIYNSKLPSVAPTAIDSVRKQVASELKKNKVKLMPNTTVVSATAKGSETVLQLRAADGTEKSLTVGAYVPSTGVTPNTAFAPAKMLDGNGFIKQTAALQAEGYADIFVIGDAGSLQASKALYADAQAMHLVKNLPVHLSGGKMAPYEIASKDIFAVTLGRSRGSGQMGTFKLFSFLVWWMKGRYLGTDYAGGVAAGKRGMQTVMEK